METKCNKIFPKPVLAEPPVSHGVPPLGGANGPVNMNVLCLGVSFVAFKGHLCMLPFASSPLKDVYSPLSDKLAPLGLSLLWLFLQPEYLPWCVWIPSWNRKKTHQVCKICFSSWAWERDLFSLCPPTKKQSEARGNDWELPHTSWDVALRCLPPPLRCLGKEPFS